MPLTAHCTILLQIFSMRESVIGKMKFPSGLKNSNGAKEYFIFIPGHMELQAILEKGSLHRNGILLPTTTASKPFANVIAVILGLP